MTCVDCHMPEQSNDAGETYPSHHWTSPLKTVEDSCLRCHGTETPESLIAKVEALQGDIETRMNETAYRIVDLIDALEQAAKDGTDEAILTEARMKHRTAQWYWDFVFVENSEGFHNNSLSKRLLDQSKTLTEEALAMLQ